MINWEKTIQKSKEDTEFAEGPELVSKTTKQKVVWECDNKDCDAPSDVKEREFEYNYARKKEEKAKKEGKPALCQRCSHAHRRGKTTVSKERSHLPLPPEVSDELTFQEYGYYATKLKPWSRKHVVVEYFDEDGDRHIYTPTRAQLNTYKSVQEFGHFKPTSWWTKQRRSGKKASEDTKQLMKESQQKRRDTERRKRKELEQFFRDKIRQREQEDVA